MPVVDIERWGAAPAVFMSMLVNHISWYNSRIGCGIKCDSLAVLGGEAVAPSHIARIVES
jgi:hypothetical protein